MKEQKYFRQTCHSFDWFLEHVVGQDRKWIPLNTDQEVQKSGKLKSGNQCVGLNIGMGFFRSPSRFTTHIDIILKDSVTAIFPAWSHLAEFFMWESFKILTTNSVGRKNKPQKIILWWSNHARRLIQFGL